MTAVFNIWNPYLRTPSALVFDVTPADAFLVGEGSSAWILQCLRSCSIDADPVAWRVKQVRQSYYSDYLHSSDWHARWDIAWIIEVTLASPVSAPIAAQVLPFKVSDIDETADDREEPALLSAPALVVASFPAREGLQSEVEASLRSLKSSSPAAADVQLEWRPYVRECVLARSVIESVSFPEEVEHLETLQASLRTAGGLTNWQQPLSRL